MLVKALTKDKNVIVSEVVRSAFCPQFHHAVELVGRRWNGAIIRAMLSGAKRFSAIAETVPGMSDRMLAERLRELEEEGIVVRTVIPETPVRIEYTLSVKGRELDGVVAAMSAWAERWIELEDAAPGGEEEAVEAG